MARPKRASMREGPLADLFRSTVEDGEPDPNGAAEDETRQLDSAGELEGQGAGEGHPQAPAEPVEDDRGSTEPPATDPEPAPPEPDEVTVYRVEDEAEPPADTVPAPSKERLRDIFVGDPEGKAATYGRSEPAARSIATPGVPTPVIRVVGVGGAGVNAVNRMVEAGISGVEFLAINTDLQSLQQSMADVTVHIGGELTRGLGSGSDPSLGYKAAFEEQDKIKRLLKGSDMVFVTAGVGGGTGTGAAPVVARLAQTVGALTLGIVTKPFAFEGTRRATQAEEGIGDLEAEVDTLIVVPNERLLSILSRNTSMIEAFGVADDVLRQGVQGIADLVTLPAVINLDFADVRTTMRDAGAAILGIGMGTGDTRASFAAERAISSPLLDSSIDGARSILLSITGGNDLSLIEVSEAAKVIQEAAHPDAHIIFGANIDEELNEQVWVTVIATRFDGYGRRSDRSSRGRSERLEMPRPEKRDRKSARADVRPRDLGIEAPEFEPSQ
jgi:cell division protein FtsZ